MMAFEDARSVVNNMSKKESLALRRCAQYRMRHDDSLEEIGSSDISYHAIYMVQCGEWPTNFSDVPLGFLVDKYCDAVSVNPEISPSEVYDQIAREGSYKICLPAFLYEGKHSMLRSAEDREKFAMMSEMFAPVED